MIGFMELTTDHKIQIFCAALTAIIQADATTSTSGAGRGSGVGVQSPVDRASAITSESIAKFLSKAWQ
jgi:hypothetical protein